MIEAPLARPPSDKLIVKHLDGETIIFDRKHNEAYCLNAAAGLLWRHSDGVTSVEALAALLREELSLDADEDTVWVGLESLQKIHLLERCPALPCLAPSQRQLQRRKLIMAIGTTITTAFVTSIVAPMAQAAASCVVNHSGCTIKGNNCTLDAQCCSCNCNGSGKCT